MTHLFRTTIAFALTAYVVTAATAQNSSLMHAPSTGPVPTTPSTGGSTTRGTTPGASGTPGQAQTQRIPNSVRYPGQTAYPGQYAGYPDRPPITLESASWTFQAPPPLRIFQKNDVVTIRVDEITRVMAEGASESRKRTLYEAILTDWIRLKDWRIEPDPQVNGDPAVTTESNQNYRAESTVESRESMTFNIAATVVDIRPNGSLVLEARKTIRVNDNLWETSLSGICRAQDVAPDNVVLSKDLIDLEIRKQDRGHMRDGYKRGWFQRFLDRYQPF